MDTRTILNERSARYGDFDRTAEIIQSLKSQMYDSPNWDKLPAPMKEAFEMIQHKIGRALNGDPFYVDNWQDIAGYAQLVVDILDNF